MKFKDGGNFMRIGGHLMEEWSTPRQWAEMNVAMGYNAVRFPTRHNADIKLIDEYVAITKEFDFPIAEVGIWNNFNDPDPIQREKNRIDGIHQLELADYVGAACCINISGSCSSVWDGPHKDNLTEATFEKIVENTQRMLDEVKPKNTCFAFEPMPWMYPHTADSYLELIKAIDRDSFSVHFDFVNVINSIEKYYNSGAVINEWFEKLGDQVKSCHIKDIKLATNLTMHFSECQPGTGDLDYPVVIENVRKLSREVPIMLEHMAKKSDYEAAMKFLKTLGV